jgi:hypothetical protein
MQVTRRLRRWLYSVDGAALDASEGAGFTTTNTVLVLPPTPDHWRETRERYLERLRYEGIIRFQWLTEFQRRGVPHLHGCGFFPGAYSEDMAKMLQDHWLAAARPWAPERQSQWVNNLWGLPGWFQYQAKHSARGVKHYQRANVPEAWQKRTGRLWGVMGEWPTHELVINVDQVTYWRFRRTLQRWLISCARSKLDTREQLHRLTWLRRMLIDPERKRSAVRAMGEFCPASIARQLLIASLHDNSSGSLEPEPNKAKAEAA